MMQTTHHAGTCSYGGKDSNAVEMLQLDEFTGTFVDSALGVSNFEGFGKAKAGTAVYLRHSTR